MTAIEFNYKLETLQDKLSFYAHRLTNNHEEVQDLVQETCLKAITYKDKFADQTNLNAWLYTIMKNTFINNYRRSKRINSTIDVQSNYSQSTLVKPAYVGLPHAEFVMSEIESIVSKLDDTYRIPFELYHMGYKYKEISEKLEISLSTVKNRIFWARKKLKDMLKEFQYMN